MIEVVIQPIVEVNQPVDFKIYFREEPDCAPPKIEEVDGVEFAFDIEDGFSPLGEEKGRYIYETYVTFTKTGELIFPEICVTVDGIEYKTKSYPVCVVDKIEVDDSFLKTVLISDKDVYDLQDVINIRFFLYSRLSNVSRTPAIDEEDLPEGVTKERLLDTLFGTHSVDDLSDTTCDYCVTGIKGFQTYLKENFEIRELFINIFNEEQEMEEVDGVLYIKTKVFCANLLPRKQGEFIINPSIFDYTLYKGNMDYSAGFTTMRMASNPLKIVVI